MKGQTMLTKHHRHYRSASKRGLFSFLIVTVVMTVGTFGMHFLEGLSYLDSFYFISMIATAQGPTLTPLTAAGKIFAALMSFVSVGAVVASLGFLFGPFLGQLWKIGVEVIEKEKSGNV